jgi:hypothetical protein
LRYLVEAIEAGCRSVRRPHEHTGAAAEARHARLGDRKRKSNRDRGINGIAAFGEHSRAHSRGLLCSAGDDALSGLGELGRGIGDET